MKMLSAYLTLLVVGITCASTMAVADDPLGLYVGAGAGSSEITDDGHFGPYFHAQHFAWNAIAGIRPISPVGAEVAYIDFGNPHAGPNYNFRSANSDAKAAAVFGVGYLPLPVPFLDVYGKVGVARLDAKLTADEPGLC